MSLNKFSTPFCLSFLLLGPIQILICLMCFQGSFKLFQVFLLLLLLFLVCVFLSAILVSTVLSSKSLMCSVSPSLLFIPSSVFQFSSVFIFSSHWFFFTFSRSLLKFLLCLFILFSNSVRILITNALNSLVSKSFICFISLFFQGFSLALSIKKKFLFSLSFFWACTFFYLFIITCIYHLSIAQFHCLKNPLNSIIHSPALPILIVFFFFGLSLTLWN